MAKANPRGAVAGRAKGATGPRPPAPKGSAKPAPKSAGKKAGAPAKSAPSKSASPKHAPTKSAPPKAVAAKANVTKNSAAAKSAPAKPTAAKGTAAKGGASTKGATPVAPPAKGAAKGAAAKGAAAKTAGKHDTNTREKSTVTKGGADKKGADAKAASGPPPPPPRKIQVMQVSSLKPGAKGSKASVALIETRTEEKVESTEQGAKKRRSAELTKQQIDHFRELLSQRRERLASDLHMMQDEALKVTAQDNSSDSVADTGTDNYEQDFTLGLIESEEVLAREIDEALLRIDQAKFGVCESCETPVPLARLEILPFARFCITCQQKREAQG